ncbi:hypothetical protein QNA24_29785 [Rhodococcus qingshengii]|nr:MULTISPECIES: hypothetical protein [Rhodococcus]MCD2099564.1 hypothetical protein [Rhodococcus rhodochrous]MCD2123932.1 hypothetical protein [Rhodococcus rhodochrous]MCQ4136639.1 hypothetical protein [Rhodococcus rhodochrous]MDJ0490575.1 hypothetical protein [Rhodococcus qingshengii]
MNLASLRADLRVVESEIKNPPSYARIEDLIRSRNSLLRRIARAEKLAA